jgi:hypothetical protein
MIYLVEVKMGDRWIPMYAPDYSFDDSLKKLKSKWRKSTTTSYRIARYKFDSVDARTPDYEFAIGKEY